MAPTDAVGVAAAALSNALLTSCGVEKGFIER